MEINPAQVALHWGQLAFHPVPHHIIYVQVKDVYDDYAATTSLWQINILSNVNIDYIRSTHELNILSIQEKY